MALDSVLQEELSERIDLVFSSDESQEYGSPLLLLLIEVLSSILGDMIEDCNKDEAKNQMQNPGFLTRVQFRRRVNRATRQRGLREFRNRSDEIVNAIVANPLDATRTELVYDECCFGN